VKSDPVSPQGRQTLQIGDVSITIETPPDLDALLDRAAQEAPHTVDGIPYYAILWPSARGLAEYLWHERQALKGSHVIELGCGLGMPAILAAKLGAAVDATDFHPDTGEWLLHNAKENSVDLTYQQLDWNVFLNGDKKARPSLSAPFVIGSDLLYESRHIPALVCTIDALCQQDGHAIISDPGRDNLPTFVTAMERIGWKAELIPVNDIYVCRFGRSVSKSEKCQ
jgi:predicted nicotinamide N-methyase